ncbi:MAG: lactate racemase domain-containing protein [Desulfosudaceae bacterium]
MALVRQSLYRSSLAAVRPAVMESLQSSSLFAHLRPGARIAIGLGSRGIGRLDEIVAAVLDFFKQHGFEPIIVPAMGSHGGGTPEGQRQVLDSLGITAASPEVTIDPDMSTDCVGRLECGMKVLVSRSARSADHIFVINRVKPHTKFTADRESGLAKMLAVGLGKADGAAEIHRFAVRHSFEVISEAAAKIMAVCPVLGGLAILEDGHGQPARIETVAAGDLLEAEQDLLAAAKDMLPKIPLDQVDLLIVDRIGKNISGIGMDSNVTGRHRDITGDFCLAPHPKRIFVRDLAPESHGNANGIGLADFTTSRLVKAMDRDKTNFNALIAISPEKAAIPLWFETDREAIAAGLKSCGLADPASARVVRIRDTSHLGILSISRAFENELRDHRSLTLAGDWESMRFDGQGNLADLA